LGGLGRNPPTGPPSLVVPVASPRGHDLGVIGVVLPAGRVLPDTAALRREVGTLYGAPC
jgi:hypothetical protein